WSNALVRTSPSFPTMRLKLVGFTRSFIISVSRPPVQVYIVLGLDLYYLYLGLILDCMKRT
ncbi:MAG TPA: hypothetical protein VH481_03625, partial [Nitrososphaeraceae archaeon]